MRRRLILAGALILTIASASYSAGFTGYLDCLEAELTDREAILSAEDPVSRKLLKGARVALKVLGKRATSASYPKETKSAAKIARHVERRLAGEVALVEGIRTLRGRYDSDVRRARNALAAEIETLGKFDHATRKLAVRLRKADQRILRAEMASKDSAAMKFLAKAAKVLADKIEPSEPAQTAVGPAGGVIVSGNVEFRVPAGALSETVTLHAVEIGGPDAPTPLPVGVSGGIEFFPDGTVFDVPIQVSVPLPEARQAGSPTELLSFDGEDFFVEARGVVSADGRSSAFEVRHFSSYFPRASDLGFPETSLFGPFEIDHSMGWSDETPGPRQRDGHQETTYSAAIATELVGLPKVKDKPTAAELAIWESANVQDTLTELAFFTFTSGERYPGRVYDLEDGARILFKNEEAWRAVKRENVWRSEPITHDIGNDYRMTAPVADLVVALARRVEDEFFGLVSLRVTEAFDTRREHKPQSLHYEGRAVDLTMWVWDGWAPDGSKPGGVVDLSLNRALAHMAHEVGFDYVLREKNHVHASVDVVEETTCASDGAIDIAGFIGAGQVTITRYSSTGAVLDAGLHEFRENGTVYAPSVDRVVGSFVGPCPTSWSGGVWTYHADGSMTGVADGLTWTAE